MAHKDVTEEPPSDGGRGDRPEYLNVVDEEVERALANCPYNPIERLFWFEHCLRLAARKYSENKSQANNCLLRRAAVLYADAERDMAAKR